MLSFTQNFQYVTHFIALIVSINKTNELHVACTIRDDYYDEQIRYDYLIVDVAFRSPPPCVADYRAAATSLCSGAINQRFRTPPS